jgi:hypothetical protein
MMRTSLRLADDIVVESFDSDFVLPYMPDRPPISIIYFRHISDSR